MKQALIPLLLLAPLTMGQDCYNPPDASCEYIDLTVDAFGRTTVMNFNPTVIDYDLDITASVCTSSDCPSLGVYHGESLAPNSLKLYEADTPAEYCLDVYCCNTGAIYRANASLTLLGVGCQKTASVVEDSTCQF